MVRIMDVNVSGCENTACSANGSSPFHVMGVIGCEGASPPRRRIIRNYVTQL